MTNVPAEDAIGSVIATVTADPPPEPDDWEDPPRRQPELTSPLLTVDGFEGPLDWLLEMARTRKLDLRRLSIRALIDCFANEMEIALPPGSSAMQLARWAGWTVMAAQLTELRAQLMLPADTPDAPATAEAADGQGRHWFGRAEMRAAADWLERRPQLGQQVFARGQAEPGLAGVGTLAASRSTAWNTSENADDDRDRQLDAESDDLTELLRACLLVLRLPAQLADWQPPQLPFWSVGDATARISRLLPTLPEAAVLEGFLPAAKPEATGRHRRAALAATLIAGLELARGGTLRLEQDTAWKPIRVARGQTAA